MVKNKHGEKVTTTWHAPPHQFVRCPYPGCTHVGQIITKVHCRNVHEMEREEVGKLYGMPKVLDTRGAIISQNNGRKLNNPDSFY